MPYSSVKDVPSYVPKEKRKQWLEVFNSSYKSAIKDGKSKDDAEASAFAQANGVAGPKADKVTWPQGLVKIGTPVTGFTRGIAGPFRCGHCEAMDEDGFCQMPEVKADPEAPHDDQGRVPVSKQDCCNFYEPILGDENISTAEKVEKRMSKFKKFIPFVKIDETKRQAWGIVTAEVPDKDDEVCDYAKSKPLYQKVIDEFSKATDGQNFFPLREMHQLSAVGKCIGFEFRDSEKEIYMGFEVVDDDAWKKVQKRVYTGFSQGGSMVGDLIPDPVYKNCMRYVADPSEVSLVDNPCLGVAHFAMVKADGSVEICKLKSVNDKPEVKKNANGCEDGCDQCMNDDCSNCSNVDCDDDNCINCPQQNKAKKAKGEKRKVAVRAHIQKRARIWVNKNIVALTRKTVTKTTLTYPGFIAEAKPEIVKYLQATLPRFIPEMKKHGKLVTFDGLDVDLSRLKKGMCEVSCLANLLEHLGYLCYCVINEQAWEGDDDSKLPEMLIKNLDDFVNTFLAMVAEETDELKEDIAARIAGEKAEMAVSGSPAPAL